LKNKYAAGRKFEWSVLDILRRLPDHIYSTRTPGSRTPADIVAVLRNKEDNRPLTILIQCKYGVCRIQSAELDFLRAMRDFGLGALIAHRKKGVTKIELWSLEEAEINMKVIGPGKHSRHIGPGKYGRAGKRGGVTALEAP
jgi:hypothetical protein